MTLNSKNQHISYSEVDSMLGQGASSKVYLGHLSDGTEVAVMVLTSSSVLVYKQFKTEASFSVLAFK